jgi:hypothetical protein
MQPLPLDEIFAEWRKIYLEMLSRGASTEEALQAIANLMAGDPPQ